MNFEHFSFSQTRQPLFYFKVMVHAVTFTYNALLLIFLKANSFNLSRRVSSSEGLFLPSYKKLFPPSLPITLYLNSLIVSFVNTYNLQYIINTFFICLISVSPTKPQTLFFVSLVTADSSGSSLVPEI